LGTVVLFGFFFGTKQALRGKEEVVRKNSKVINNLVALQFHHLDHLLAVVGVRLGTEEGNASIVVVGTY
jgi:hypothetical protein